MLWEGPLRQGGVSESQERGPDAALRLPEHGASRLQRNVRENG